MDRLRSNLLELVRAVGPSGFEGPVRDILAAKITPYAEDLHTDRMGNLIATKTREAQGPTVALLAHMDEVSMVVTRKEGEFIYFHPVGTINKLITYGLPVLVLTESGPVPGVTCSPTVHLLQNLQEGWIDVGDRYDRVEVGDHVVFDTEPRWLDDNQTILASKALDDRAGCTVLLEVARRLQGIDLRANVVFAFTVQEEVGARGAQYVGRTLAPDYAIAIDTGLANDPVEASTAGVKLGMGPVIDKFEADAPDKGRFVNFADPGLVRALKKAGDQVGAPYHVHAGFNYYTDAAGVSKACLHTKAVKIGGAPRRYSHSPYEVTSLRGMEHSVSVLVKCIENEWGGSN